MQTHRETTRRLAATGCMLLLQCAAVRGQGNGYSETKLLADDGEANDTFGNSVAISGETVLVGAFRDDVDGHTLAGSAYVFERDPLHPSLWRQTTKLGAADKDDTDWFGYSVALSGDTAVIGAYRDEDLADEAGSSYVFERDPYDRTLWIQTAKLTAADGAARDFFGAAVSVSGDTALIGAYEDDTARGAAYVFRRDLLEAAPWSQSAKLTAADRRPQDQFGRSLSIAGDTAIIGAFGDDDRGESSGAAYVFDRESAGWTEVAKLLAADGAAHHYFGWSVAIFGDTVVVGAYLDDDVGEDSGAAYVFERDRHDRRQWHQTAKLTAADGAPFDFFGRSVAISGDTVVIGAAHDDDHGSASGSAYVFERDLYDPTAWNQTAKLTASDGARNESFGGSVATSSEAVAVGASLDDDLGYGSGSAYVYSPRVCELALAVHPARLRAGEELRVAVTLHHRRPLTVTVPFLLWVEDASGHVVARKSSPPITMEPGDQRRVRLTVTLPPGMPTGTYRVLVGVRRMQQGIVWASREFEIVE